MSNVSLARSHPSSVGMHMRNYSVLEVVFLIVLKYTLPSRRWERGKTVMFLMSFVIVWLLGFISIPPLQMGNEEK